MLWIFVMASTLGVVFSVPIMVQNLDGVSTSSLRSPVGADTPPPESNGPSASTMAFAGFTLLGGGLCGLVSLAFDPSAAIAAIAALCLGVATGAISPEVLAWLRERGGVTALAD